MKCALVLVALGLAAACASSPRARRQRDTLLDPARVLAVAVGTRDYHGNRDEERTSALAVELSAETTDRKYEFLLGASFAAPDAPFDLSAGSANTALQCWDYYLGTRFSLMASESARLFIGVGVAFVHVSGDHRTSQNGERDAQGGYGEIGVDWKLWEPLCLIASARKMVANPVDRGLYEWDPSYSQLALGVVCRW